MATTNTSNFRLTVSSTYTEGDVSFQALSSPVSISKTATLANSASDLQFAREYDDTYNTANTITTSDSIALTGGTEVDAFGNTITFSTVTLLYIENTHSTEDLTVDTGGMFIDGVTDSLTVPAEGVLFFYDPTGQTAEDISLSASTEILAKVTVLGDSGA